MAKATMYNKGIIRGKLSKAEIVKYKNKKGESGEFLSLEVNCKGNRAKATMFASKADPNKIHKVLEAYPVGSLVQINGGVQEKEYKTNSGKTGIDRSVNAFIVQDYTPSNSSPMRASFILQGIVEKIREVSGGGEIKLRVDNIYTTKDDVEVVTEEYFNLTLSEDMFEIADSMNVAPGCNAKFKGQILNILEEDEYGDIIGSIQSFRVEVIEAVVDKDELDDLEDKPAFL
jgi:hypothetical protein